MVYIHSFISTLCTRTAVSPAVIRIYFWKLSPMSDPYLNIVALHGLLLKTVIKLTKLDDLITAVCAVYSGVYVAAVVHHADRVLVTDDGRIPMVEVDDAVSVKDASFMTDYYWLLKVGKLFSANVHFCVHLDLILLSMHFVATTSCCEFCARTYYAARLAGE